MPVKSHSSLDELRVLELCGGVAGAYCGKLFADYGAEVIKVEPPGAIRSAGRAPSPPQADLSERRARRGFTWVPTNAASPRTSRRPRAGG